jgi:hypothetical protein
MRSFAKSGRIFFALTVRPPFGQSLFSSRSFDQSARPARSDQRTGGFSSFVNNSAKPSKSGQNLYSYNSAKSAMAIRPVTPRQVTNNLSDSQRAIMQLISDSPGIARRQIVVSLGFDLNPVRDDLEKLESLGLIERSGKGRGTVWYLKGAAPAK